MEEERRGKGRWKEKKYKGEMSRHLASSGFTVCWPHLN